MSDPASASQSARYAEGRILLDIESDGLAVIRFNNPAKHNAMSIEMWEGFALALKEAAQRPEVRVLVLTGDGGKAFVSGADISQFETQRNSPQTRAEYERRSGAYGSLLSEFPRPTISCIRGYCMGGGLGVALGTDIRIASRGSRFGIPAAKLDIAYPFNGLRVLNALVGPSWARLLMYSAMQIDAAQAERIGLVTRMVEDETLWEDTLALARTIAGNAPLSVRASKVALDQIQKDPADRDMEAVRESAARCARSEDSAEGRRAFMEKRAPRFVGR